MNRGESSRIHTPLVLLRVLSKYNHREHRENILFQEVNRNSVSSPLCPLYCYPLYPTPPDPLPGN